MKLARTVLTGVGASSGSSSGHSHGTSSFLARNAPGIQHRISYPWVHFTGELQGRVSGSSQWLGLTRRV